MQTEDRFAQRIIDWLDVPDRKPAIHAFTAGHERQIAYRVERLVESATAQGLAQAVEIAESVARGHAQSADPLNSVIREDEAALLAVRIRIASPDPSFLDSVRETERKRIEEAVRALGGFEMGKGSYVSLPDVLAAIRGGEKPCSQQGERK